MGLELDLVNMPDSIRISDFGKICRTCLIKGENMISLYSFDVIEMIEACSPVHEVEHEKLPQQICKECYTQLATAHSFKQRCEISAAILCRAILQEEPSALKLNRTDNTLSTPKVDNVESKYVSSIGIVSRVVDTESTSSVRSTGIKTELKIESAEGDRLNEHVNISENDTERSDDGRSYSENESDECDEEFGKTALKSQQNDESEESSLPRKSLAEILLQKYNITDLTCNICQKTLSTHSTLLRHMKTHDKSRVFKYHCPVCNKGFFETGNLNKHVNRHEGNAKYKCEECQKLFYELSALATHARQKHSAEPLKCSHCSSEFYHELQLKQHESSHETKEYRCEYCDKVFNKMFKLKCHQVKHSSERPFGCSLCDKTFKFKFTLTKHKILCHSSSPPRVMCNICGKLVTALRPHMETHNKNVIYKCPECPRQYTNRNILGDHVRNKHKNVNKVKPFKHFCNVCGKGFHTPRALKFHTAVHTGERPFECQMCEKKYISRSSLDEHVRSVHKNDRPHSCAICKKAFHTKMILKNHMRTHTGERPFPCTICGKAFGFKSVLKTHMKIHS